RDVDLDRLVVARARHVEKFLPLLGGAADVRRAADKGNLSPGRVVDAKHRRRAVAVRRAGRSHFFGLEAEALRLLLSEPRPRGRYCGGLVVSNQRYCSPDVLNPS